ncbi:AAA family ATPase [Pseudomaricurvus alkylphenolicus]|uniref:ATP-binding protein n=1 Tax=Pseudomaricurvus alkylphenolicus TaxID=1306991 RepID=UPI00141DBB24|nr:SbcC/MukB-like Walker B domain-containing protein [Pseudomaricurvus alkylphenolicus]NIB38680.1 AAA family ATPase [Pseudomaricurvus alkylphenolicus]
MSEPTDVTLSDLLPPTYSLCALRVHNWGPFQGFHSAEIDPGGTAIIGPTGSGKTSLEDALMTLICAQPWYNLASTGGHEGDRNLMSYVRGVSGAGNDAGGTTHIARPQKTLTALEACFDNGETPVTLAAVLWIDSSSQSVSDLKRAWIFSENTPYGMPELLETQQASGLRGLKQLGREVAGLVVSESKKTYLAQLRRFFDVGENAFTLLNRAAGLKQINSIDELFRELVLDDHSAFVRAAEVAAEFDDLASIHSELETAKLQQKSLVPIAQEHEVLQTHEATQDKQRRLERVLPVWFAMHGHQLWTERIVELEATQVQNNARVAELHGQINAADERALLLRDQYMEAGGASVESLQAQIDTHQAQLTRCQKVAHQYTSITQALGLDTACTREALQHNQTQAQALQQQSVETLESRQEQSYKHGAQKQNHSDRVKDLNQELSKIAKNHSNIPSRYVDFQADLAQALEMDISRLPFIAELVEVKPEHRAWRGAIERAIGGQRLRLLVPPEKMKQAITWINHRRNRLHVRLLRVEQPTSPSRFLDDGFTRKLNFKSHPYRDAMKQLLAGIDRHCVERAEKLDDIPWALTVEGSMSGKSGHFEKQDQRDLDQDWCTGFDNRDRINSLEQQLEEAKAELMASETLLEQDKQACSQLAREISLLEKLCAFQIEDIDATAIESTLALLNEKLRAVLDPQSDTAQLKQQWDAATEQLQALRIQHDQAVRQGAVALDNLEKAQRQQKTCFARTKAGLSDEEHELGNQHFSVSTIEQLHEDERQATNQLVADMKTSADAISTSKVKLTRLMGHAKKIDTGALADVGLDAQDAPNYIERLRVLNEEALPEKLHRFLEYLNQSSDQGVTQLLMAISSEVEKIEHRIEELNHTMRRVDYQPGRYLRLNPQAVVHESLTTLTKAQRHLRYAATLNDEGDSHYKALKVVVDLLRDASERKRTKGAQALLDPRYRLQFSVSVIDRSSSDVIETRRGSQGGSGGEKEIIASYILTASLSYALCPEGSPAPLFGTVVLDEAFSRSSQAVAGRIIAALREFGLHPLFITPNKEIKLLRAHTRSAILIHNKNGRSSTLSLSWEELEAEAAKQQQKQHEISR